MHLFTARMDYQTEIRYLYMNLIIYITLELPMNDNAQSPTLIVLLAECRILLLVLLALVVQ
ncbi:hypothetical protein BTN33_08725 [Aeromonas veronii]|nr:hypothetical protein BTN33_08725 [Aeromonas veronii]